MAGSFWNAFNQSLLTGQQALENAQQQRAREMAIEQQQKEIAGTEAIGKSLSELARGAQGIYGENYSLPEYDAEPLYGPFLEEPERERTALVPRMRATAAGGQEPVMQQRSRINYDKATADLIMAARGNPKLLEFALKSPEIVQGYRERRMKELVKQAKLADLRGDYQTSQRLIDDAYQYHPDGKSSMSRRLPSGEYMSTQYDQSGKAVGEPLKYKLDDWIEFMELGPAEYAKAKREREKIDLERTDVETRQKGQRAVEEHYKDWAAVQKDLAEIRDAAGTATKDSKSWKLVNYYPNGKKGAPVSISVAYVDGKLQAKNPFTDEPITDMAQIRAIAAGTDDVLEQQQQAAIAKVAARTDLSFEEEQAEIAKINRFYGGQKALRDARDEFNIAAATDRPAAILEQVKQAQAQIQKPSEQKAFLQSIGITPQEIDQAERTLRAKPGRTAVDKTSGPGLAITPAATQTSPADRLAYLESRLQQTNTIPEGLFLGKKWPLSLVERRQMEAEAAQLRSQLGNAAQNQREIQRSNRTAVPVPREPAVAFGPMDEEQYQREWRRTALPESPPREVSARGYPVVTPQAQADRNAVQKQILLEERAREVALGNTRNVAAIDRELDILSRRTRR